MKKFFVFDLNTTEIFNTLEEAMSVAKEWHRSEKENAEDAWKSEDSETKERWLKEGDRGLESGDIEIWSVNLNSENDLKDFKDQHDHWDVGMIKKDGEQEEIFSGWKITLEMAEKFKNE